MSPGASTTSASVQDDHKTPEGDDKHGTYECNICLETANDPVVSMCGHLFCWPCLHQWLETRPNRQTCPVCKAAISKDKVIPLYGRGNPNPQDPREKLPPRPAGQRTEPEPSNIFQNLGFGGGASNLQFSFGLGPFPFGIFASTLNYNHGRPNTSTESGTSPQQAEDQFMSKVFLWLAILFICWLIIT